MKTVLVILCSTFLLSLKAQPPTFQWVKHTGSNSSNEGTSVKADASGNVYTTGVFKDDINLNPGGGNTTIASKGEYDIYLSKVDAAGNFQWARSFGGQGWDQVKDMALDAIGNVYVTGYFKEVVDFDPSANNEYTVSSIGIRDAFVAKFDTNGNFIWVKCIGDDESSGNTIAVDPAGNVYVAGNIMGNETDFDPGAGTYTLSTGSQDAFVLKLTSAGNFIWAKTLSGGIQDNSVGTATAIAIDLDSNGNVCVAGNFTGDIDFDPGFAAFNVTSTGTKDGFIVELNSNGNFLWVKSLVNSMPTKLSRICDMNFGPGNKIYVSGFFTGNVDFNPGAGANILPTTSAEEDAFILKLNASGNFMWVKTITQQSVSAFVLPGFDLIRHRVNADGNIYATGSFQGRFDFDPDVTSYTLSNVGANASFGVTGVIFKWDSLGVFNWAFKFASPGIAAMGADVDTDVNGNIYTTGSFNATVDFDPGAAISNLTCVGSLNSYTYKLYEARSNTITTSLQEQSLQPQATLYPNPTHRLLKGALSNYPGQTFHIQLVDETGRVFADQSTGHEFEMDVAGLSTGVYYLKVIHDQGLVSTYKILKH